MYHFVDERVDFSLYQQINIIALNTWQNAIYLQIHPVQFSLKKHDASLIAPTTFCFVRPDGDLAEHTSFQGKKNTTNLFIYFFFFFTLFYSQTRSSVPVANKLMNSLMEKWFRLLIQ